MNTLRPAACRLVVVAERHWSTRRDRRSRGQLRACCNISTCTASTGGKTLSASRSKTRSIRTPAPRPYRRFASRNFSELYSGRLAYACQRPGRAASCTSLTAVTLRWPPMHYISPPSRRGVPHRRDRRRHRSRDRSPEPSQQPRMHWRGGQPRGAAGNEQARSVDRAYPVRMTR